MKQLLKSIRNWPPLNALVSGVIRSGNAANRRIYNWLVLHWPVSGTVAISVPGGMYKVLSKSDDYIAKNAFFGVNYEPGTDHFMEVAVHQRRLLFDVGGNTGHFSLAACAMNPALKAVSFEPVPSIFKRLQQNLELNAFQITAENLALSDSNGTLTLFVPDSEISYSASSDARFHKGKVNEVKIPACTMDQYVQDKGLQPDLIKIDVEWHEMSVLKGAVQTLRKCSPVLVVEVLFAEIETFKNPALKGELDTQHAANIQQFMSAEGYYFYKPMPDGLMRMDNLELNYDERNYVFSKKKSSRQFISYLEKELLIRELF